MSIPVFLWLVGAIGAGGLLLFLGLRGKRINDHPVCRQCRFDLHGSPDGTVTCPECGAGLKRPGSIVSGQRRRRPVLIGLGALAVGVPALAIGTVGFAMFTGQDVHRWMPLGVLLFEARHADPVREQQVAAEVLRRYQSKGLSPGQEAAALATALEVQGTSSLAWATEWGDLIDAFKSDGKLNDEDDRRYRNQAAVFTWKVRPRVGAGDPIPIVASLKEARIGSATLLNSMVTLSSSTIDGAPARRVNSAETSFGAAFGFGVVVDSPQIGWVQMFGKSNRMGWGSNSGSAAVLLACPKDLPPGRHTAKVRLSLRTMYQTMGAVTWGSPLKDDPDAAVREAEVVFEVLPPDVPGVQLVEPTPDVKDKMETLLDPTHIGVTRFTGSMLGGDHANLQFNIDGRPMEFAFDVVLRHKDREWPMGALVSGAAAGLGNSVFFGGLGAGEQRYVTAMVSGFDVDRVDVILRPSLGGALKTLDAERIYGAEIVYKDYLVDIQEQSMSRTRVSARPRQGKAADAPSGGEEAPDDGSKRGDGLFKSLHKLMRPW